MRNKLIVTIDTECDKSATWHTKLPLSFHGVLHGIPNVLTPLFEDHGIKPTYLLSSEVIADNDCCKVLEKVPNAELSTHLHGDYLPPNAKDFRNSKTITDVMQLEYSKDLEFSKMETLTELFKLQFGYQPRSFRAGRFGASKHTGQILKSLNYWIDSSVTPHVNWATKHGLNYEHYPENPYFLSHAGDIKIPGFGGIVEAPVTILNGKLFGNPNPMWLRPWYSSTEEMCQIIDYVVKHQPDRPLILMFHNVEIIPGASPYPQTGEEVQRYITSMSNVFKHASSLGVTACSLKDYAEEFTRKNMTSYTPKTYVEIDTTATKPLAISHDCVVQALDQAKVQPWFRYIFEQRQSRPDVLLPVKWIEANSPKTSSILSIGGGTGFNMLWLAQQGFTNLTCLDIDSRALAAGKDLATQYNFPVTYREDDALKPKTLDNQKFDIIEAVNWLSCVPNLEFDKFVQLYCNHLTESGILIFDVIDSTFTQNWHSQDSRLPEAQRRPSEYKTRLSETEVLAVLLANQLHAITTILVEGAVPKRVYIAAKSPASNPSHLVIPSITAKHSKFATFKQLVKKCMVKSRLLPKGINK